MVFFRMFLLPLCFVYAWCYEVDLSFQEKFQDGETQYKELIAKSYGSCWHEALSNLHSGCKQLTEEIQSRLALSFTNCFLGYAGSQTCLCPEETPIANCLSNSSDRVFSTYTEFYTHTQSICHYLQHREWQQQTENTVKKLSENAEVVSNKLDQSSASLTEIIHLQKSASVGQRQLISNGRVLSEELRKSRTHAKHVFEDFKSTTEEQRILIFAVFDRIKSLQHLVLGEFTTVYTIAFYTAAVFVVYIVTSLPQTANARLWLILVVLTTAVAERTVAFNCMEDEMAKMFPLDVDGPIYSRIWIFRKIACVTSLSILIYMYYNYKDYNAINHKLLQEIQQQNNDLQHFIKSIKAGEFTSTPIDIVKSGAAPSKEGLNRLNLREPVPFELPFSPINGPVQPEPKLSIPKITPLRERSKSSREKLTSPINSPLVPEPKLTLPKKTPLIQKRKSKKENNTPKENITLSSIENIAETGSVQKRYNLRSRTNSPAQSSFGAKSSPLQPKDLIDAVSKHF